MPSAKKIKTLSLNHGIRTLFSSGPIFNHLQHQTKIKYLKFCVHPAFYIFKLPFNFRMLKEFVLISFIKPDVRKTLNIINLWHVDNIINKL